MNTTSWHALRLTPPAELIDPLSGLLLELGAGGVWEDGPELVAYFSPDHNRAEIGHAVNAWFGHWADCGVSTPEVVMGWDEEDDDGRWITAWQAHFKPIPVGARLIVLPEWEPPERAGKRLPIRIRPGHGFGTGSHDTTALCLEAVEAYMAPLPDPARLRVLDVGCGSGILAIGAARLGATHVFAFDNNPAAIGNAADNVALNGVNVSLAICEADAVTGAWDVVLANLISHVIVEVMPELARLLAPGGRMILSGILSEQSDRIDAALLAHGLKAAHYEHRGMWVCVEATRKESPKGP